MPSSLIGEGQGLAATVSAVAIAALALLAAAPPAAGAATGAFRTGLHEDPLNELDGPARRAALDRMAEANASLIRISLLWRAAVGTSPPADPTDPFDPAYDFESIDAEVRDATARGLGVMFTVRSAPDWAEGADRPQQFEPGNAGTWKPDPKAFGDFGEALAKRYSGGTPDPAGPGTLPRVRYYEAWNEPNLNFFLAPQYRGEKATGAQIYRRLLNSFAAAVKSVHGDNKVVGPALAPFGGRVAPGGAPTEARTRTRPLRFLRELLCLEGRNKLTPSKCPRNKRARIDILSHHPIAIDGGPDYSAQNPDDASAGDLDRVRRVLRAGERAGNLRPGGHRPLWATEYWWRSDPPNKDGLPLLKQARYVEESLYVFWRDGADAAFYWDLLDGDEGFGLLTADGAAKPSYRAFSFPFVTERTSRRRLLAWGKAPRGGRVRIERKKGGNWRTLARRSVSPGEIFTAKLQNRQGGKFRAVVGGERSIVWRQP